jgi:hypothetical protein
LSDVRSSYVVSYAPPAGNWDGQFHRLRVACARKGVRLQAASGYYATEPPGNDEQAALDGALAAAFDTAEIGMRCAVSRNADDRRMRHFEFRIDASDVRFAGEGDRHTAHLALQFAGFMPGGKVDRSKIVPLDLAMSPEEYAKALKTGITFTRDILVGDAVAKLRILVFDRVAHGVGSLTMLLQ